MTIDNDNSKENQEIKLAVLRKIAPDEIVIVGRATVSRILEGRTFRSIPGGHQISTEEAIGLIASIAALTEYLIIFARALVGRIKKDQQDPSKLIEKIMQSPETSHQAKLLIEKNPKIVEDILAIVLASLHEGKK